MLLRDVPYKEITLPSFTRIDGESFNLKATLYDFPDQYDYWLVIYHIKNEKFGHKSKTLMVSKKLASALETAEIILKGTAYEILIGALQSANKDGMPLIVHTSPDGWTLL